MIQLQTVAQHCSWSVWTNLSEQQNCDVCQPWTKKTNLWGPTPF